MSIILLVIWFLLVVIRLDFPLFSFHEVEFVPEMILHSLPPPYWWVIRFLAIGSVFFFLYSIIKQKKLSLIQTSLLLSSPWIFIVAREYNPLSLTFLVLLTIVYISKNRIFKYSGMIIFFIFMAYNYIPDFNAIQEKTSTLFTSLSFISLFFQLEGSNYYLHIDKIGYFPYIALPFFIIGLVDKKIYKEILPLAVCSLVFYFLYPRNYFIFAGIGLLFVFEIVILNGLSTIKFRFAKIVIVLLLLFNFFFFLEMYSRHYEIKYGSERGYNEYQVANFLINKNYKKAYLPSNDGLKTLMKYYSHRYKVPEIIYWNEIDFSGIKNECSTPEVLCVMGDTETLIIKIDKEDKRLQYLKNPNGLRIYYLL